MTFRTLGPLTCPTCLREYASDGEMVRHLLNRHNIYSGEAVRIVKKLRAAETKRARRE